MRGATECRFSRRRPIPLVIRGSCRAPRLAMGAPKARNRDDADRLPVVVASADRILHTPKHRCEPRSRGRAGQLPHPVAVTPWRKAANSFGGRDAAFGNQVL